MTVAQDIKVRLWASVVCVCVCVYLYVSVCVFLSVCCCESVQQIHTLAPIYLQMCACVRISKIITVCFSHSAQTTTVYTGPKVCLHTVCVCV